MDDLPGPIDALFGLIKWLGVPALVLLPVQILLLIREWVHAASYTVGMVDRFGRAAANGVSGSRVARAFICLLSQALAGASAYATAQFYILTTSSEYGAFLHLSWTNMLTPMLTYTDPHSIPLTIGLLTLGWLLALDVASAMEDETAYEIVGKIRFLYIFSGIATVLLGLLLIVVISGLVGFVEGPPWLGLPQFVTGTVIGFLLALSGYVSFATARPVFGPPQ